jgi:hypothetical protein
MDSAVFLTELLFFQRAFTTALTQAITVPHKEHTLFYDAYHIATKTVKKLEKLQKALTGHF